MEKKSYTIWRYLNFAKFINLLEEESLYFTRADKFEDPLEGRYLSDSDPDGKYIRFQAKGELKNTGKPIDINVIGGDPVRKASRLIGHELVVNCWHINESESNAMWRLYLDSVEGIAIQTNSELLEHSLKCPVNSNLIIRPVEYLDYEKTEPPSLNALDPYFCKRKAFEYESELRAIITLFHENAPKVEHGILIPVDLKQLIKIIHIAPQASKWFFDLVNKLLKRYGLNVQVTHSKLYKKL